MYLTDVSPYVQLRNIVISEYFVVNCHSAIKSSLLLINIRKSMALISGDQFKNSRNTLEPFPR
jgi:hypothetical protein